MNTLIKLNTVFTMKMLFAIAVFHIMNTHHLGWKIDKTDAITAIEILFWRHQRLIFRWKFLQSRSNLYAQLNWTFLFAKSSKLQSSAIIQLIFVGVFMNFFFLFFFKLMDVLCYEMESYWNCLNIWSNNNTHKANHTQTVTYGKMYGNWSTYISVVFGFDWRPSIEKFRLKMGILSPLS